MNLPNFNIFKDLSDKYFLSAFPGAILSIIIIGLLTSSYVLAALFAIVWIIVCATTCEIIKNKRLNKINKDLDECCRSVVAAIEALI